MGKKNWTALDERRYRNELKGMGVTVETDEMLGDVAVDLVHDFSEEEVITFVEEVLPVMESNEKDLFISYLIIIARHHVKK